MRGGQILCGQIAVVITIILVMTWAATQWIAWRFGFQPQRGNPWFELAGWPAGLLSSSLAKSSGGLKPTKRRTTSTL